jgi:hypothetical protein
MASNPVRESGAGGSTGGGFNHPRGPYGHGWGDSGGGGGFYPLHNLAEGLGVGLAHGSRGSHMECKHVAWTVLVSGSK